MKEEKTVWHWWTGWEIEKVENWLEKMEQAGWNLYNVDYILRFKFEKGESRKMSYCVDYQYSVDNYYFLIFKEDGWVLMDENIAPWYIWRKSYENERPTIYTDTKSLVERNNRQIRNVFIGVFISLILLYLVLISNFDSTKIISALLTLSLVFYGYLIVQYYRYSKKMKRNAIKC